MPPHTWACPVTRCAAGPGGARWHVHETASDVEALADSYARWHHGELPGPAVLGPLRIERVVAALAEHLQAHSVAELADWIA